MVEQAVIHKKIRLICKSVWFYSMIDEDMFFEWIKRIPCITKFDALGDELYLYIDSIKISDSDLDELLGLFYRYKVDMKQLKIFLNEDNKEWFCKNKKAYWFRRVFGS